MTGAGWPRRFEVLVGEGAGAVRYRVVTWEGPTKAETLARDTHRRQHAGATGGAAERVELVEVDPPARTSRGTVALEPDDVIDRLEF